MEKTVRVLQFGTGNFGRGGQSTIVYNFGMELAQKNIIFDYFIDKISDPIYEKRINELGGKVYNLNIKKKNIITQIKKMLYLNKILSKEKYKIVHLNSSNIYSAIILVIFFKIKKIEKIIIHSHSTGIAITKKIKILIQKLLKNIIFLLGDEFLACSKLAAEWFYPQKYLDEIKIVNNGIDIKKYKFSMETRDIIRRELNLEKKFVIGNVGRFSESKNHKFLIEIFTEIEKQEKKVILLLIGEGELKKQVKIQVEELKLQNKVIFIETTNEVEKYLQAMDVFCFPTKFEGLGIVAIEAQAAALKVIASDKVPLEAKLTEYLEFFSLDKSAKEWAKKVLEYKNGYKRKDMSKEIRNKGYSIKDSVEILERIYLENKK